MRQPVHLQRLLDRLEGVKPAPAKNGFYARCPAHDDRCPSLWVGIDDKLVIGVKCHAGCVNASIVAAVSLSLADLFPDSTRRDARIVREHRYHDVDGTVLYAVRKVESTGTRSSWRMAHPEGDRWVKGRGDDVAPVMYRLPPLMERRNEQVWLTEGERDADTLAALGLVATTVASGSWTGVDTALLAGRRVVVVIDNDTAGWQHGIASMDAVQRAGGTVDRVVRPDDRHNDLTDHKEGGGAHYELRTVDLHHETPPADKWGEPDGVDPSRSAHFPDGRAISVRTPVGVLMHYHQTGDLTPLDVMVWMLMEHRAGDSGVAHLTGAAIAELLDVQPRTARTSLNRLAKVGLVSEERRNRWTVFNPCDRRRAGEIPADIYFLDRTKTDSPTPFFPLRNPNTNPGNGTLSALSRSPETRFRGHPNRALNALSRSPDEPAAAAEPEPLANELERLAQVIANEINRLPPGNRRRADLLDHRDAARALAADAQHDPTTTPKENHG